MSIDSRSANFQQGSDLQATSYFEWLDGRYTVTLPDTNAPENKLKPKRTWWHLPTSNHWFSGANCYLQRGYSTWNFSLPGLASKMFHQPIHCKWWIFWTITSYIENISTRSTTTFFSASSPYLRLRPTTVSGVQIHSALWGKQLSSMLGAHCFVTLQMKGSCENTTRFQNSMYRLQHIGHGWCSVRQAKELLNWPARQRCCPAKESSS